MYDCVDTLTYTDLHTINCTNFSLAIDYNKTWTLRKAKFPIYFSDHHTLRNAQVPIHSAIHHKKTIHPLPIP